MVLEESLDLPVSALLPHMQRRILTESVYFGVPTQKNPLDLWVYQELVHAVRPDIIVELGLYAGGSTLALAHLCEVLGHGRVIGVDRSLARLRCRHPRIHVIEGDAAASAGRVREQVPAGATVLVIEDSAHTYENTLAVLDAYAPLVSRGSYFIVEDGICGHGLEDGPRPGPYEAIAAWLPAHPAFVADRSRESFLVTWNPNGFLKRVA